jgi:hypothetical protein
MSHRRRYSNKRTSNKSAQWNPEPKLASYNQHGANLKAGYTAHKQQLRDVMHYTLYKTFKWHWQGRCLQPSIMPTVA